MKDLFLPLVLGILLTGCSTDRPQSAISTRSSAETRELVDPPQSPASTLSEILESSRIAIPRAESAFPQEAMPDAEPSAEPQRPPIHTVRDLLTDPQFREVVAALENAER